MIKLNKPLSLVESWEKWQVKGVGLYALIGCNGGNYVTNEFNRVNGFYIITDEDEESRTYFYLSTDWQSFRDNNDNIVTPVFPVDCDILARRVDNKQLYIIRVNEESRTVYINELKQEGVTPLDFDHIKNID